MMTNDRNLKEQLEAASREAAIEADAELENAAKALKRATAADLSALRPSISDKATFDKVVQAVVEATSKNMSVAELQTRLAQLGAGAVALAKEVAKRL